MWCTLRSMSYLMMVIISGKTRLEDVVFEVDWRSWWNVVLEMCRCDNWEVLRLFCSDLIMGGGDFLERLFELLLIGDLVTRWWLFRVFNVHELGLINVFVLKGLVNWIVWWIVRVSGVRYPYLFLMWLFKAKTKSS